jgi:hypothetical protein
VSARGHFFQLADRNITLTTATDALTAKVKDPGVDGSYDAAHLGFVKDRIGAILRNSAFPARSGDVYYLTTQWMLFSSKPTGTSHGDPWPYDTMFRSYWLGGT